MGFQRHVEDFDCVVCGWHNSGTGYTNHCCRCLHSLHVDRSPGDRANPCRGLLRPMEVEQKDGKFVIVHRCERCATVRRCKVAPNDNIDAVIRVSANRAE